MDSQLLKSISYYCCLMHPCQFCAGAESFLRMEAFLSQPVAVQQSREEAAEQYACGEENMSTSMRGVFI